MLALLRKLWAWLMSAPTHLISRTSKARVFNAPRAIPADPGGGGGGDSALLDTLTITNDSGSTQAANFITEWGMLKFKRGDLAEGTYPVIENAAVSFGDPTPWQSDDSVMLLPFFARVSQSVAGSGTLDLDISGGGSAPASSSRTITDMGGTGSSQDLKLEWTIFEGGGSAGAVLTASLNYAIDNGTVEVFADGPAGKAWIVTHPFRTTAPADHDQLWCRHYITVHQDENGDFHSGTWMPKVYCPKISASSPARMAGSLVVKNGASTLKSFDQAPKTFTYAGSADNITVTGHGWDLASCEVVKLSTDGSLPTGLSSTVAYNVYPTDANTAKLLTAIFDGGFASFSTSGSGTHSITRIVGIDQYTGFYACDVDGLPWFVAGTGTRCTTRARQSKAYELSTKLFPSWADDETPTSPTETDYRPNTAGQMQRDVAGPGGRPDIAIMPEWCAVDFKLRTEVSDKNARVMGLIAAQIPMFSVNATTKRIVPVDTDTTTWASLGTGDSDFRCRHSTYGGNVGCAIAASAFRFFSFHDNSHIACLGAYQWLVHGAPWFRDIVLFSAQASIVIDSATERTRTVSATPYHPVVNNTGNNLIRSAAWAERELGAGAYLLPTTMPEQPYFLSVAERSSASLLLEIAGKPAGYQADGLRFIGNAVPLEAPWAYAYEGVAWAWLQCISDQDADWKTLKDRVLKFAKRLRVLTGGTGQLITYRMQQYYNGSNEVREMAEMAFTTSISVASVNTGTNVVTFTNPKSITLADGDKIQWPYDFGSTKPSGIANYTTYELDNVSGNTAQIVPLGGGSPVSLGSNPGAHDVSMLNANHGNIAVSTADNATGGYYGVWRATISMGMAAGTDEADVDDVLADLETMYGIDGQGTWAGQLKHYMQTSFT